MPLPLGHAAIGFTAYEFISRRNSVFNDWTLAVFVLILANLPDIDVFVGLLIMGNANVYHRGPTHSLAFAFVAGLLASRAWKVWSHIPRVTFWGCFFIILSHVLADLFLTRSPVSLFWPFEVSWGMGQRGWGDVFNTVFLEAFSDTIIVVMSIGLMMLHRLVGWHSDALFELSLIHI